MRTAIGKMMDMKQYRMAFAGRHYGMVDLVEERQRVLHH